MKGTERMKGTKDKYIYPLKDNNAQWCIIFFM
uniref:Uncharacterized protein n=1 Tax=viral metagenome TaxID=1070528 RepID=A0A6C0D488_9ZZZZ